MYSGGEETRGQRLRRSGRRFAGNKGIYSNAELRELTSTPETSAPVERVNLASYTVANDPPVKDFLYNDGVTLSREEFLAAARAQGWSESEIASMIAPDTGMADYSRFATTPGQEVVTDQRPLLQTGESILDGLVSGRFIADDPGLEEMVALEDAPMLSYPAELEEIDAASRTGATGALYNDELIEVEPTPSVMESRPTTILEDVIAPKKMTRAQARTVVDLGDNYGTYKGRRYGFQKAENPPILRIGEKAFEAIKDDDRYTPYRPSLGRDGYDLDEEILQGRKDWEIQDRFGLDMNEFRRNPPILGEAIPKNMMAPGYVIDPWETIPYQKEEVAPFWRDAGNPIQDDFWVEDESPRTILETVISPSTVEEQYLQQKEDELNYQHQKNMARLDEAQARADNIVGRPREAGVQGALDRLAETMQMQTPVVVENESPRIIDLLQDKVVSELIEDGQIPVGVSDAGGVPPMPPGTAIVMADGPEPSNWAGRMLGDNRVRLGLAGLGAAGLTALIVNAVAQDQERKRQAAANSLNYPMEY